MKIINNAERKKEVEIKLPAKKEVLKGRVNIPKDLKTSIAQSAKKSDNNLQKKDGNSPVNDPAKEQKK